MTEVAALNDLLFLDVVYKFTYLLTSAEKRTGAQGRTAEYLVSK